MTDKNPLGKATEYPSVYTPELLFAVPRATKRAEIGVGDPPPFWGSDVWTAYEISWLNNKGLPRVAIGEFQVPCTSKNIVESKSLKLYLGSLSQTKLGSATEMEALICQDISAAVEAEVAVRLYPLEDFKKRGLSEITGSCLDLLDVECEVYDYNPDLLRTERSEELIQETLYTHLLKSNCLITSQPDWGTLIVEYSGLRIDRKSLLKYVVSFRNHNEFHEQCAERIFQDIMRICKPEELTVIARYTRRGGLDINPWRSNAKESIVDMRLVRQ